MASTNQARGLAVHLLVCLSALILTHSRVEADHNFKVNDEVPLLANKVGPYHNPTETYQFYSLPFCQPEGGKEYKLEDLGEVGSCSGTAVAPQGQTNAELW